MNIRISFFSIFLLTVALPLGASAQLHVSELVNDGMVVQRDAEVPIQGSAAPGSAVTLTFAGETYSATADERGNWTIMLPPMKASSEPRRMTVASGGDQLHVDDVLIGDVWIASGQSNMEWVVADVQNAEREMAAAHDDEIRHFKVPRSWAEEPEDALAGGAWEATSPETVGDFTAVGYFFARNLREHTGVPIGLINTSWGGSRIEPWMSAEMLTMSEADVEASIENMRARKERIMADLREKIGLLPEEDQGMAGGEARWADPALDDAAWEQMNVPSLWEQAGYAGMDGIGWYRTSFTLSEKEAQQPVRIGMGTIDDSDVTWVNGVEVGRMEQAYSTPRAYTVPASALRAGRNVVAVRVEDTGGGGGIYGDPGLLYVETGSEKRSLAGTWKFNVGMATVSVSGNVNQIPTLLYNKMIYPLLDTPITGVIWYQGESNAGDAYEYRELFADMIEGWREDWTTGEFPFLFVQLANFEPAGVPSDDDSWAVLRESQSAALDLPETAQAVTIDVGNPDDIHPRNKQDVGARLALAARSMVYGEDVVYSGPAYRSHRIEEGRVVVSFDHVGGGLKARGGDLVGFTVAGDGGLFVPAQARIEGDRVVVHSERVAQPEAVRYGWKNNPEDANLYNAEGLPASPFRTDGNQR